MDIGLTNEAVNIILLVVGVFAAVGFGFFFGAAWLWEKFWGRK